MPRLPQPGGDKGTWGTVLNDFLYVAHNEDGSLKPITSSYIEDGAITASKLMANNPASGQVLSYTGTGLNWVTVAGDGIVPDADEGTKGLMQLTGDLGGTADDPQVTGMRGYGIASSVPVNDQVLTYNATSGQWEPQMRSRLPEGWHSVKDFGATGDGSTDDTEAIQTAINTLNPLTYGSGGGVVGTTIYFPPGEYRITNTIDFHRFAGTIIGNGTGNSPRYSNPPGHASVIRWDGPAGISMIKVSDSRNITFSQLRLQGNNTNIPLAGIEFYAPSSGDPQPHDSNGSGTNQYMVVEDCYFGVYTWTPNGSSQGHMTNGILVQDPDGNGNNDQFFFSRNWFNGRLENQAGTAGIRITSTQSIWGSIENCMFNRLGSGVDTVASVTMFNGQYNRCITNVVVRSTAQVHEVGHWTEGAGQIIRITSGGGAYHVRGGKWQLMAGGWELNQENDLEGHWIYAGNLGLGGRLIIDSVQITMTVPESWTAYIRSGNAVGNSPGRFQMINCVGIADTIDSTPGDSTIVARLDRFNMRAGVSAAGLQIDIDNPMLRYKRHLVSGASADTTPQQQHRNVATGFFGVAPVARPVLAYSRAGEPTSTAAVRQALSALGLVEDNTTA